MLHSLRQLYRESGRYALACPLLFLVPISAEAAQHVAEYAQGFYVNLASAKATEHSQLRIGFGTLKVAAVLVTRYWMVRWLEWDNPSRTLGLDRRSLATFTPLLLLELALSLPTIWVPVFAAPLAKPLMLVSVVWLFLEILLSEWNRTATIGEDGGPIQSSRVVARILPWAIGFNLAAIIPPMIVHYIFGMAAVRAHGSLQFATLAADTLFVGYLSAIICGVPWFVSKHARSRDEP